jgi:hypothetical protein
MNPFTLPIGLRMVSRAVMQLCAHSFEQFLTEMDSEYLVAIRNYGQGHAMKPDYLIHK